MIKKAKTKSIEITWLSGSAENIPTADRIIESALATLTMHHWTNLLRAFTEICRVLKEKREILILSSTPEQIKGCWLNHYFPEIM